MYPVSANYLEKIVSDDLMAVWYGTITTQSGTTYNIVNENINLGSTTFVHEIVSGSSLEIGSAYSKQLELNVYVDYDTDSQEYTLNGIPIDRYDFYGSEIRLYFRLYLDEEQGTYEDVPCGGTFYTALPEILDDTLKLTAYDGMDKFNQTVDEQSVGTAYEYLSWMCDLCDITLGSTQEEIESMPNADMQVYLYTSQNSDTTYLDALGGIAALLNGFAVLGTDDALYIKQYKMTPDRSISDDWRYAVQLSDYETNYSSISLTDILNDNIITEHISPNEGLEYDLGENPYLQYGLEETKEQALTNIIESLGTIYYTPFEATVPIDPSLEVGDVLEFTNGRAVSGKYAAITSIEYTLDGSTTIRCVGENPRLLNKNTSTDKDLQNIIRSIDSKTLYYYDYVNIQTITIGDNQQAMVVTIDYVTTGATHIDFHAEIKHDLTVNEPTETTSTPPQATLTVTYYIDEEEVDYYYPVQMEVSGTHLLSLMFTFSAKENTRGKFVAYLAVSNGSLFIDSNNARAYIAGQGLVAKGRAWDGTLELYDDVGFFNVKKDYMDITEEQLVRLITPTPIIVRQSISVFDVADAISYESITETRNINNQLMIYSPWTNQTLVTSTATVTSGTGWVGSGSVPLGTSAVITLELLTGIQYVEVNGTGNLYSEQTAFLVSPDEGTTWYGYDYTQQTWTQDTPMNLFVFTSISSTEWAKFDLALIKIYLGANDTIYNLNIYGADDDTDRIIKYIMSTAYGNKTYNVELLDTSNDVFELRTSFTNESVEQTIDSGYLSVVSFNRLDFETITNFDIVVE